MPDSTPGAVDWVGLAARWEARMAAFFPGRDESISLMFDLVAAFLPPHPGRILDLGSGPGPLARRALERWPDVRVVALDFDPVLLRIGRETLGDADGRLSWVAANLREPGWARTLDRLGRFDAALSLATLHHLRASTVRAVYRALAGLLPPGGLFVNVEAMAPGRPGGRLAESLRAARTRDTPEADTWWDDVAAIPELATLAAEREALLAREPTRVRNVSAERHCRDLRAAGFAEAALVWRRHDETMVAAIR